MGTINLILMTLVLSVSLITGLTVILACISSGSAANYSSEPPVSKPRQIEMVELLDDLQMVNSAT